MDGFLTEPIVLSGRQAVEWLDSLRNPNREYLERRNGIFEKMDAEISIQRNGMDMEVEIPGLDLSFIDEMDKKVFGLFQTTINENVFFVSENEIRQKICTYHEIGKDKFTEMPSVRNKKDDYMDIADTYQAEQIADAA